MLSYRRRSRLSKPGLSKVSKAISSVNLRKRYKYLLLVLVVAGLVFTFLSFRQKYWDGKNKLSVVVIRDNGDGDLLVFDPVSSEITDIKIPAGVMVDSARELGKLPLSNLWKLGKLEGNAGGIYTQTLIKNFNFPVYTWAGNDAINFYVGGFKMIASAVFSPYATNLSMGDKISMGIFSLGITNIKKHFVDLTDTPYLSQANDDGIFQIEKYTSSSIESYFADVRFTAAKVKIEDAGVGVAASEKISQLVNVLGGKVVVVDRVSTQDMKCGIKGNSKIRIDILNKLLLCDKTMTDSEIGTDLVIILGNKFAKNF